MNVIKQIHEYLSDELSAINEIIKFNLSDREELIKLIGRHLINSGGKRIRPLITILISKMFGLLNLEDVLKLSTAIEFIHAATLLHDDVVDDSSLRRFKPTANFIWGNKPSILVGDYLLSQAFNLMVEVCSIKALKSLSRAATILIEGEVAQLDLLAQRRMISNEKYDAIITAKTAELFSSAAEVGGILSDQDEQTCKNLKNFGLTLGKIFQIKDDLLDYLGTKELIGKNLGDDFFEGKITLPIIYLYEKLSAKERSELEYLFTKEKRSDQEFISIQDKLKKYDIQHLILNYLESLKNISYGFLNLLNPDVEKCREYLLKLVDFTIYRNF